MSKIFNNRDIAELDRTKASGDIFENFTPFGQKMNCVIEHKNVDTVDIGLSDIFVLCIFPHLRIPHIKFIDYSDVD